jgi:hypothetical protein
MNPSFVSLVFGLSQQAESAIRGDLPPGADKVPGTNAKTIAQALIDTLGMLEEKTRGNLTPDEQRLLNEALTALRFRFVQTGGPASP